MSRYFVTEQLSERISETPQGFLVCADVAIARTGTQEYLAREIGLDNLPGNTVVVVDRPADEVFHPDTLASFEAATVTLGHPSGTFVTADNWRHLAHGHLQNVRRGVGDQAHLILADMVITDPSTIGQVKGGLREVSCGYDCQYVQDDAGNWRQTQIRGNHVAIVPRGRAGPECSIKDSIMSKIGEKIKAIWARATDEAAAAIAEAEPVIVEEKPLAVHQSVNDAIAAGKLIGVKVVDGVIVMAADADLSSIVADLMSRSQYYDGAIKELTEQRDAANLAIKKLQAEDPEEKPATDAAIVDQDTIARAEIVAPGCAKGPGVELVALTACYATDAGKRVIDALNKGVAPTADTAAALLVPVAEVIKATRIAALHAPATDAGKPTIDATARFNASAAKMFPLS